MKNYVIQREWITRWSTWITEGVDFPGVINQKALKKQMLKLRSIENDSQEYYQISRTLFYFFQMCFGGGPAIVTTDSVMCDSEPFARTLTINAK